MGKRLLTEDDRVEILREVDGTKQDKLTIDDKISSTSTNPVQSKAVYTHVYGVNETLRLKMNVIKNDLQETKQDKLTIDTAVDSESTNPVQSKAVYGYVEGVRKSLSDNIGWVRVETDLKQDAAYVFGVTIDEDFTVHTVATEAEIMDAVFERRVDVIARVLYLGRTYLAPLIKYDGDEAFVFDMFDDSGHIQLRLEKESVTETEYSYYWRVNYIEVVTPSDVANKADKTERYSYYSISHIELCDNSEYTIDEVSNLSITYPEGNFLCSLTFTTASSGVVEVKLPVGSKFIGEKLTFDNGETWELSIKNGVVVGGAVGGVVE